MKLLWMVFLAGAPVWAQSCDRTCLERHVDQYLDAVIAHNPKALPVAKNVKFTGNGQTLELGDGLWNTMSAKGTYRVFVTDVARQQVSFLGSIKEDSVPAMLALRLKIDKGQIAEVETFIQRSERSALGFEKIGRAWKDTVPAAERMPREELVRVANMYFSGMQKNDGKARIHSQRIATAWRTASRPRIIPTSARDRVLRRQAGGRPSR